jgi:hypothetical protein
MMIAWKRALGIAALALTCGGCGALATGPCLAEHGYVDVSEADPFSGQTPAEVSAQCVQEGGRNCDIAKFISRGAAECIARAERLPTGLRPWRSSLVYNVHHKTVIWGVESMTSSKADRQDGRILLIHATSGKVLERSAWSAIS